MKHFLSTLLNRVLFLFLSKTRGLRPLKEKTGTVLLVQFAHIGDFIVWLDSARMYRKLYPDQKITFLCRKFKSIRQLAQATGLFDEVIEVDDGWKRRIFSVMRMTRKSFDIVINTRPTRDLQSDLYILAPRSRQRIAPASDLTCISKAWLNKSDAAYTRIIPCGGIETMELIRNAQFVRGLGAYDFLASLPVLPEFNPPKELPHTYFAVCVGANNPANRWPPERFAKVIDAVTERYNIPCVLIGNSEEYPIGEQIRRISKHPDRLVMSQGKTTLTEYIELIRRAEFLISNDTSAGHIAPAVRTPAIVIQPGWNYGRFFPYRIEREAVGLPVSVAAAIDCVGCGRDPTVDGSKSCLNGGVMKCILSVTPEDVIQRCVFQIKQEGDRHEFQGDTQKKTPGNFQRGGI